MNLRMIDQAEPPGERFDADLAAADVTLDDATLAQLTRHFPSPDRRYDRGAH